MEQVEVEITGMVITQRYGTLNTGDILRTDAEFAKHLVEEANGAKYTHRKPAVAAAAPGKALAVRKPAPRAALKPAEAGAEEPPEAAMTPAEAPNETEGE